MDDHIAVVGIFLFGLLVGILVCHWVLPYLARRRSTDGNPPIPYSVQVTPPRESAFIHTRERAKSDVEQYALWQTLTRRETQVAEHAARGLSNAEVGAALQISPRTVEGYLQKIYSKLGVRSRTELANFVRDLTD